MPADYGLTGGEKKEGLEEENCFRRSFIYSETARCLCENASDGSTTSRKASII
jgi:hypothetical protein